jgi:GT2 family glycosyltransferase
MGGVCAVVITHNRRAMLARCLTALAGQSRPAERTLVVDNASSDGTVQMLEREFPEVEVLALESNQGGAGGFHAGMRHAFATGAEWLWLMDDDTLPEREALAELLAAAARVAAPGSEVLLEAVLLASRVVWRDGSVHPLNYPTLERRRMELVLAAAEAGVLPLRSATFVSLLVHRTALERYGLPARHFFLWSDDIEYTSRVVLQGGGAYFVPASVVLHDTEAPADFRAAPPERFYYHVRNTLLIVRSRGRPWRDRLPRLWIAVSSSAAYLRGDAAGARLRLAAVARGWRDGLRDPPADRS